jgi:hypothetical protein
MNMKRYALIAIAAFVLTLLFSIGGAEPVKAQTATANCTVTIGGYTVCTNPSTGATTAANCTVSGTYVSCLGTGGGGGTSGNCTVNGAHVSCMDSNGATTSAMVTCTGGCNTDPVPAPTPAPAIDPKAMYNAGYGIGTGGAALGVAIAHAIHRHKVNKIVKQNVKACMDDPKQAWCDGYMAAIHGKEEADYRKALAKTK